MAGATLADFASMGWGVDYSRIPNRVYIDEALFDLEQEKIFRGPCWHLLGLACEVPAPGDFVSTYIGTTPVVLSRGSDDALHAYVNRCAHRGARVITELRGNNKFPTCPYHNWRYDAAGNLKAVPMENGMHGKGGYPDGVDKDCNSLQKLRVEVHAGVVFATFRKDSPPLKDYLGRALWDRIALIGHKPLRLVGYQSQTAKCNWKIFVENNRDTYHGPQLHNFVPKFGLVNPTEQVLVEVHPPHALLTSRLPKNQDGDKVIPKQRGKYTLQDTSLATGVYELEDIQLNVLSIFPSSLFTCIRNLLTCRRLIAKAPGEVEIQYILFGYEDDDEALREARLIQGNLLGPSGYIALEDAEFLETVQNAITKDGATNMLELGGRVIQDEDHFLSEASIRSFWKGYCALMDIPVETVVSR